MLESGWNEDPSLRPDSKQLTQSKKIFIIFLFFIFFILYFFLFFIKNETTKKKEIYEIIFKTCIPPGNDLLHEFWNNFKGDVKNKNKNKIK